MNTPSEAFACGKVILLGEHAVVYGAPALAAGIDRGLRASVRDAGSEQSSLTLGSRRCVAPTDGPELLGRAWTALLGVAPPRWGVDAVVDGELPAGVGLGFSAAAGVALGRAVELLAGQGLDAARVRARAMAWERVFHGNPSGVDVAAAAHEGLLRFSRREPLRRLRAAAPLELCVGLTGGPSPTGDMVARVAALRERERATVDGVVAEIGRQVEAACGAVERGDLGRLGELLDDNQRQLERLGVSSAELAELCCRARDSGALGAKLTGAGGSGAVIALVGAQSHGAAEQILGAWRSRGCRGFRTVIRAERDVAGEVPS